VIHGKSSQFSLLLLNTKKVNTIITMSLFNMMLRTTAKNLPSSSSSFFPRPLVYGLSPTATSTLMPSMASSFHSSSPHLSSLPSSIPPRAAAGTTPAAVASNKPKFQAGSTIVLLNGEKSPKKKLFNKHKAIVVDAPNRGCWLTVKPLGLEDNETLVPEVLKWRKGSCQVLGESLSSVTLSPPSILTPFQLSTLSSSSILLKSSLTPSLNPFAGASFLRPPTSFALGWGMITPPVDDPRFNAFSKPIPGFPSAFHKMKIKSVILPEMMKVVHAKMSTKQHFIGKILPRIEPRAAGFEYRRRRKRLQKRFNKWMRIRTKQPNRFRVLIQRKCRELDRKRALNQFWTNNKDSLVQLLAQTWR
jgi:hypothetical protein